MKKKSLLITILVLIAVLCLMFSACQETTVDKLQNDYGVTVEGGVFDKDAVLVTTKVEPTSGEGKQVLDAIADVDYNKNADVYIFDVYITNDGVKVQPDGKVKVTIPLPDQSITACKVLHIKENNQVETLTPTIADGKLSFETSSFSYFVLVQENTNEQCNHTFGEWETAIEATCEQDGQKFRTCPLCKEQELDTIPALGHDLTQHQGKEATCLEAGYKAYEDCSRCNYTTYEEIPALGHADAKWNEGKEPTCTEEGIVKHYHCDRCQKNFNENFGEIASLTIPVVPHEYGDMYYELAPDFFRDGNIAYYQCGTCKQYFDEQLNKVDTVVIPKLSANLSICVNGTPTALVLEEQTDNHIIWTLEGLAVTKGDVITICQTDKTEITYNYSAEGNVGRDGKIITTAVANVVLTATPNGLMLNISGYVEEEVLPKDIYIDETTTYALVENANNAEELCYLGLVLESYDDFRIRDTKDNFIADLTLSAGTTGAQTTGASIMVENDGTYNIYINKTTHEVRIELVPSGDCPEGECVYDQGVVTKEPTHLEEGVRTFTCTICGKTKDEPIAKTSGHEFGNWMPDKDNPSKHYRECGCGEAETDDCEFNQGVVIKEPTHLEEGVRTLTCTICGRTKEEPIATTGGHEFGDWTPDELNETKHYKQCGCGEVETGDCTFEAGVCTVCGREQAQEGIIIVVAGGTATFVGKETAVTYSNVYGENANVYVAQENDVLNVTLTDQAGRVFKHWASAKGTIIPDEDFAMLVLTSGYYYPVFEDTDEAEFTNRVKIADGNCEEGDLYMSTNSKGDIKYELEFEGYGRHDFGDWEKHNNQYHKQVCYICGEAIFEEHTEHERETEKEPTHTEEGLRRCTCYCGYSWTEAIPPTEEHNVDYDDWHIVEESKNGQYGKYKVYCKYCDYSEEYWYLDAIDFVSFIDGKMINYQYTYGGKVVHDEYYYSYRNAEGKKVYIWAIQYESERSSNADNNDTYIFMYIDDENSSTIEPIYLSKSRGNTRAEYLWAIYGYAYDVNGWIEILDSPDWNIGCENGMVLGNSMSARSSVFESYHNYWAETYNKLRIPTSKAYNDFSDSNAGWEVEYEGTSFTGGYTDENGEYVTTGGREVISFVKDRNESYKKYMYVDKATGITYGYEDYTSYRTIFIMRSYKTIVSPEEYEQLDEAGKSVSYSYGSIESDIQYLCSRRTLFNNFTLTLPETTTAFRFIFSDPVDCVEVSGSNTSVYNNSAHVYNSGNPITLTWVGEEGIAFDRYEIWDFANQKWVVLSEQSTYTFNPADNPCRSAAYVRVICHEVEIPVEPSEMFRITVENGYFYIDGTEYTGTIDVAGNTLVYVYANDVAGKNFHHWVDGNGQEMYDSSFTVTSNIILTPVYVDATYTLYAQGWNYDAWVSVDGGEMHYTNEFEGKVGDKFELSTKYNPEYGCDVFIGWYRENYGPNGSEYIFISDSQTFTYEITGEESGYIYAVWTTGENPMIKKYVDIRVTDGFVSYSGGEGGDIGGGVIDNAYSAISISNSGMVTIFDDPTDETVYTAWDVAYRYELEGEVMHDTVESYQYDEDNYYPARFWVSDPQYSYPDGEINITATIVDNGLEEGVEEVVGTV